MWRTVIINNGEKLTIRNRWLVVYSDDSEHQIPVDDIYAVVIDNRSVLLSVSVITTLAQAGAHIFFCNEKHIPVATAFPFNTHYQPLNVIKNQLSMSESFKDELWAKIVKAKIQNQYKCLLYAGVGHKKSEPIFTLSENIVSGDKTNREAVAAKKYFQLLFGVTFRRSDVIYWLTKAVTICLKN